MNRRIALGQSSMEYVVVCAAIALAVGVSLNGTDTELARLLTAFRLAYQRFSFALSLPT